MPASLLDSLRSIPVALPALAASEAHRPSDRMHGDRPAGPPVDGHLPGHRRSGHRGRRFRFLGAGALVAGLTVGALVGSERAAEPDSQPDGPQVAHVSPVNGPQVLTAGWDNP